MKVFLGGTCNGSMWRDNIIPLLKIDFFNPVVDNWTQNCISEELRQREICDFCLYTITPKITGIYSIAEVVDESNKNPEKTILIIMNEDDGKTFDEGQKKSLDELSRMIEQNGAKVFTDLKNAADYMNSSTLKTFGGSGSGNFDHAGRPGITGGSAPSGASPSGPAKSTKTSASKQPKTNNDLTSSPEKTKKNTKSLKPFVEKQNDAIKALNSSPQEIKAAMQKAYKNQTLNTKEKALLKYVWPEIYGDASNHTSDISKAIKGEQKAISGMKTSLTEIKKTTKKLFEGKDLSDKDKLTLQNGWPESFGKPGEEFPDIITEKDSITALTTSIATLKSATKKITEGNTLSEKETLYLQSNYPETYGKPGKPLKIPDQFFKKSEAIDIDDDEYGGEYSPSILFNDKEAIQTAVDRALLNKPLSRIEQNLAQFENPELFGPPGTPFLENADLIIDESSSSTTVSDALTRVNWAPLSESENLGLKIGWPDIFGAPGDPDQELTFHQKTAAADLAIVAKNLKAEYDPGLYGLIVLEELKKGWPDIYGVPDYDYTKKMKKMSNTNKLFHIEQTLDKSKNQIIKGINKVIKKLKDADQSEPKLREDDIQLLQLGWPEIYNPPGTPFKWKENSFPLSDEEQDILNEEKKNLPDDDDDQTPMWENEDDYVPRRNNVLKTFGGPGSGNFDHTGRPGITGGSAPSGASPSGPAKSTKTSAHERYKRATEITGADEERINAAVERGYKKEYNLLSKKDKEILQAGWPEIHGKLGTPFKTGEESQDEHISFAECKDVEIFDFNSPEGKIFEPEAIKIVKNFQTLGAYHKAPIIVLGHDENQELLGKEGLPCAGIITNLRHIGSKLISDFADVPQKVSEMIDRGAYRFISSEIYKNFFYNGEFIGPVLRRVALLGADIPKIKGLDDILARYADGSETISIWLQKGVKPVEQTFDIFELSGTIALHDKITSGDASGVTISLEGSTLVIRVETDTLFKEGDKIVGPNGSATLRQLVKNADTPPKNTPPSTQPEQPDTAELLEIINKKDLQIATLMAATTQLQEFQENLQSGLKEIQEKLQKETTDKETQMRIGQIKEVERFCENMKTVHIAPALIDESGIRSFALGLDYRTVHKFAESEPEQTPYEKFSQIILKFADAATKGTLLVPMVRLPATENPSTQAIALDNEAVKMNLKINKYAEEKHLSYEESFKALSKAGTLYSE